MFTWRGSSPSLNSGMLEMCSVSFCSPFSPYDSFTCCGIHHYPHLPRCQTSELCRTDMPMTLLAILLPFILLDIFKLIAFAFNIKGFVKKASGSDFTWTCFQVYCLWACRHSGIFHKTRFCESTQRHCFILLIIYTQKEVRFSSLITKSLSLSEHIRMFTVSLGSYLTEPLACFPTQRHIEGI